MKRVALGIALVALAAAPLLPTGPVAYAKAAKCPLCASGIRICSGESKSSHVRWAEHHSTADARCTINTENGKVTLLLTDRVVAVQLSDRTLHKVERDLHRKQDDQDHGLGQAIVAAVVNTVSSLIDNSFECRLRDVNDVRYQDGRLEIVGRDGHLLFDDTDLEDTDLATAFSEKDARRFIDEFHRAKGEVIAAVR
jgi:hypothetical protein